MTSQTTLIDLPLATNDFSADNATGADHAAALLHHMKEAANPTLLGIVAREIVERGAWSGIEIGFFHHIAATAVRADHG
jgi:hypothetical protein